MTVRKVGRAYPCRSEIRGYPIWEMLDQVSRENRGAAPISCVEKGVCVLGYCSIVVGNERICDWNGKDGRED